MQHGRAKIDASHFVNPDSDDENFGAPGGVYESQPVVREDVAREDQRSVFYSSDLKGMLTTFPQCIFSLEFPEILSQNHICYHELSVSGISEIMHCEILINMPY